MEARPAPMAGSAEPQGPTMAGPQFGTACSQKRHLILGIKLILVAQLLKKVR